jgi:hypothetical protein
VLKPLFHGYQTTRRHSYVNIKFKTKNNVNLTKRFVKGCSDLGVDVLHRVAVDLGVDVLHRAAVDLGVDVLHRAAVDLGVDVLHRAAVDLS